MVEVVDTEDLKSSGSDAVKVQIRLLIFNNNILKERASYMNNPVARINYIANRNKNSLNVYRYDIFDINKELYQSVNIVMSIDHPKYVNINVPEDIDISNMKKMPLYIYDQGLFSLQLSRSCDSDSDSYQIGYVYMSENITDDEISKFISHNNNIFNGNVYLVQSADGCCSEVFNNGSQNIVDFVKRFHNNYMFDIEDSSVFFVYM